MAELGKEKYRDDYEFEFLDLNFYAGSLLLLGLTFDILKFIARAVRIGRKAKVDGVIGTHDFPASVVAAAVARELGLPGPAIDKVLLCHHKYLCREAQRRAVPDSTPAFGLVDPFDFLKKPPPLEFPFFIKPVKATLSVRAGLVRDERDLRSILGFSFLQGWVGRMIVKPFNQLLEAYTDFKLNGNYFIAEGLLHGTQVTVEGFVRAGRVEVMGIVDSVMYPGTISFARFEYPSRLPPEVKKRMEEIAARAVAAVGFDDGCFNVELMYDAGRDAVHIIETNARICTQFSDLYEKVDGTNGYEILLALAAGKKPAFERGRGKFAVAASFVLRTFLDKKVLETPDAAHLAEIERRFPDAIVQVLCKKGKWLSREPQDMKSYRYAVVNMGAQSFEELEAAFEEARALLPFRFADKTLFRTLFPIRSLT